ncbi:MAG: hypothetical protein WC582_01855 [Patescibacteria group bacterium]
MFQLDNNKISSSISLMVAIIMLVASYFQWWDITYSGGMKTKKWVKIFFAVLIILLFIALFLIIGD